MNAAALVKQVPGPGGELVMDELCRLAVAQGIELAAAVGDGMCTAITLGPESAEDVLREAIAWGRTCSVMTDGVLLADPLLGGSDSLATARALAAAITREGPFDLVLLGAESSDMTTGQLGPQLAELLDLPFVAAARFLSMQGSWMHVRGQHDDGWMQATVQLPAVVSCAAGLVDPCDTAPAARALVPHDLIRTLTAAELGPGPWGSDASVTSIRSMHAGDAELPMAPTRVPPAHPAGGTPIGVLIEPERLDLARGLLGIAAGLADAIGGSVVAVTMASSGAGSDAGAWGADALVVLEGDLLAEDVARAVADWAAAAQPWGVLAPSTTWGREVAGRAAARLGAGLAGAADALAVDDHGRLVAWKRVDAGRSVAEIVSSSAVQLATVRPDALAMLAPRESSTPPVQTIAVRARGRVRVASRTRTQTRAT